MGKQCWLVLASFPTFGSLLFLFTLKTSLSIDAGGETTQDPVFLSLKEGDRITVIKKNENSKWWTGHHNGKIGLFNLDHLESNVVTLVNKRPEESKTHTDTHDTSLCPNLLMVVFSIMKNKSLILT